ncbi:MAG: hypothetical protein IPJ40_18850 [Saprospirales bacterium]|nr:hypothetical protein [Saprospirales bacterium]
MQEPGRAGHRDGLIGSSDEASVMGVERSDRIIQPIELNQLKRRSLCNRQSRLVFQATGNGGLEESKRTVEALELTAVHENFEINLKTTSIGYGKDVFGELLLL